ncbi:MAG: DUF1292 domain-containing protein [Oscillospiraceae bacterium]|jgi:UPF0473 protein helmi_02360|nr:DUF1292 domain-containing protein [Oscillospiraceae bacterium]
MSEEYGNDFVTIIDDEGNEFELELLDTIDYNGESFAAFLPTDMDEDDPDYGLIILSVVNDENGDELFESIDDDDKLQEVYEMFMTVFEAEDGE